MSTPPPPPKTDEIRVPNFSKLHPVAPQLYVPEWSNDMQNRKLIIKNAELGGVPHCEHDQNLFLEKREQMSYNVEDRLPVDGKYTDPPPRGESLRPLFHHHTSKYQSSLMFRTEATEQPAPSPDGY